MSDKIVNHFVLADGSTAKYDAGSLVNLDETVSLAGYAPDAKAVGDRLTDVENLAETLNEGGLELKDDVIATNVEDWLDDHPEATTTVQDHSLTYRKLVNGTLGFVTPEMYGAVGDGVTDDTVAWQSALDYASQNGLWVVSDKSYKIKSVTVNNGLQGVVGGTVIGDGTAHTGIIIVGSQLTPVHDCVFRGISVDMNGSAMGLNALYMDNSTITGCKFYGVQTNQNLNQYMLRVVSGTNNKIVGNYLEAQQNPTGKNQYLIIFSNLDQSISYGGIFDGDGTSITYSSTSNVQNVISDNVLVGGTHSIVVSNALHNIITGNVCKYASHRGVAIQSACSYNIISNNEFVSIKSAGVIMTYGCTYNEISNNVISDDSQAVLNVGEGAICGYLHIKNNKIIGNTIKSKRLYGVYLGIDVVGNQVENNFIEDYYLTGIMITNDWIPTGYVWSDDFSLPADAIFSQNRSEKADYKDSDGNPVDYVSFVDSEYNAIENNVFAKSSRSPSACVYITQIGNRTKITNNKISGNLFYSTTASNQYYMYYFEETTNYFVNNSLINNIVSGTAKNINRFYMTAWRNHFDNQHGNTVLDTATVIIAGSSFSAKYGKVFRLNNSTDTTVTSITDTVDGQDILVRLDSHSTLQHSSSIRLKGNTSITPQSNLQFVCLKKIDGILIEQYRNF